MFSLFRRGKQSAPAGKSAGKMETVTLPRSAVDSADPYARVQAVVDFINALIEKGHYRTDELPAKAMQAYRADQYLAQVNNGGHSQFIHNTGATDEILTHAGDGLAAMGAAAQAGTLRDMADWVAKNPDAAADQTGFTGGRADYLDTLDTRFFAAEKQAPLTPLNSAWIAGWPELRVVDDAQYASAVDQVAAMNPHLEARKTAAGIRTCEAWLGEQLRLTLGIVGMADTPAEPLLAIGGGGHEQIDGEAVTQWNARYLGGKRFVTIGTTHATLYDMIEHDNGPAPDFNDPDAARKAVDSNYFANFRPPERGAERARIPLALAEETARFAAEVNAGAAVHLLLGRAKIATDQGFAISARGHQGEEASPEETQLVVAIFTGDAIYKAAILRSAAVLLSPDGRDQIAVVSRTEIDAHAALKDR